MSRVRILGAALLTAMLGASLCAPAQAASLRSRVILHSPRVRLSDLFGGLQPGQDCDIGSAPSPGQQIVVPAAQLAAIASEFGVTWDQGNGFASAVVERPGRQVSRDEILAVVRPALLAGGGPPDTDLSLGVFASVTIPAEMTAPPQIQAFDLDQGSGRFSAVVAFSGPGEDPVTLRITGRAQQQVAVLALSHAMQAGDMVTAADLQTIKLHLGSLRGTLVSAGFALSGMALKQTAAAGTPLTKELLIRPMLVTRGRPVALRLETTGLVVTASGTALEPGIAGDRIHVINTLSRAILIGEILSGSEVRIDPGSGPVPIESAAAPASLPQVASGTASGGHGWSNTVQEAHYP